MNVTDECYNDLMDVIKDLVHVTVTCRVLL